MSTADLEVELERIGYKLEELLLHVAAASCPEDPPKWWLNEVDKVDWGLDFDARANFEAGLRWRAFYARAMREALGGNAFVRSAELQRRGCALGEPTKE